MKKIRYMIMKKIIFATLLALAFVFTLPGLLIMSRAEGVGFNPDAPEHTEGYGTVNWGNIESSSSSSSSSSESSSSSSSSYDNDSSASYSDSGMGSYSDSGSGASDSGSATVAAPKKNANDITVGATGGQKFRLVMAKDHTTYQVYHCGISKATYAVNNAKGEAVTYKTMALEKGADNLWYINITFDDTVDTKGYTVSLTKGDNNYLSSQLSVSGIKINGTLALSTVPEEPEQADNVIGHRYCVCGASFDIRENSGLDENAWNAHAKEHAAKGETVRWTDK